MARCGNRHIRAEHYMASYIDSCIIHQGQIEVGVYLISHVGIAAPIGMERRLHVAVFPHATQQLFQKLRSFFSLAGTCLVEIIQYFHVFRLFLQ